MLRANQGEAQAAALDRRTGQVDPDYEMVSKVRKEALNAFGREDLRMRMWVFRRQRYPFR